MADEASAILLLICSHEVWVKVAYVGPRPCPYACAYVDPVFTSQSYDISLCRPSFHLLTHLLVLVLMS